MSNGPYSTVYSSLNPSFINIPLSTFLTSTVTAPTATGYSQYMVIGNLVIIQFKYEFVSIGSGSYELNIPIPISSTYAKPQGTWYVRYAASPTSELFPGIYNDASASVIAMLSSPTYGVKPQPFDDSTPQAGLSAGDIVHGELSYIID